MSQFVAPRLVCVPRVSHEAPERSRYERHVVARQVEIYRRRAAAIESMFGRNAEAPASASLFHEASESASRASAVAS